MRFHTLEFERPAGVRVVGFRLGTARHGAMCLGDGRILRLQIDDDSAWSGGNWSAQRPPLVDRDQTAKLIAGGRSDIRQGEFESTAERLKQLQHRHTQTFLPFAALEIEALVVREVRLSF